MWSVVIRPHLMYLKDVVVESENLATKPTLSLQPYEIVADVESDINSQSCHNSITSVNIIYS